MNETNARNSTKGDAAAAAQVEQCSSVTGRERAGNTYSTSLLFNSSSARRNRPRKTKFKKMAEHNPSPPLVGTILVINSYLFFFYILKEKRIPIYFLFSRNVSKIVIVIFLLENTFFNPQHVGKIPPGRNSI